MANRIEIDMNKEVERYYKLDFNEQNIYYFVYCSYIQNQTNKPLFLSWNNRRLVIPPWDSFHFPIDSKIFMSFEENNGLMLVAGWNPDEYPYNDALAPK